MRRHLHIYKDRKGEWRWTLYASNGRKLADSGEGYKREMTCARMAHSLFGGWGRTLIEGKPKSQHAPSEPEGPRLTYTIRERLQNTARKMSARR
jgi:uncharacterized protein YegP (UPF0339 family)